MDAIARTEPWSEPAAAVLVVDDDPSVQQVLERVLERSGYRCRTAGSAESAEELLEQEAFDVVLSDVNMSPGRSGLTLVQTVSRRTPDTAVIMISGLDDAALGKKALELGAFGYMVKPFTNNEILINVHNALNHRQALIENRQHKERLERAVLDRTRELLDTIEQLEAAHGQVRRSQEETIHRLMRAAEFRDNETAEHIQRMSRFSALLARRLGMGGDDCELIRLASPMHDVGKIGIEDRILLKPGRHTPEERQAMQKHAEIGYRILSGADSELLDMAAVIAHTHHERWDGTGYPRGLAQEDIPLEGRITAIADVFDALTSVRVYKPAYSVHEAARLMEEGAGLHFDPTLLRLFLEHMDEVLEIRARYADRPPDEGAPAQGRG